MGPGNPGAMGPDTNLFRATPGCDAVARIEVARSDDVREGAINAMQCDGSPLEG